MADHPLPAGTRVTHINQRWATRTGTPVWHWPTSFCLGGNAPGKPIRAHCTCDMCF